MKFIDASVASYYQRSLQLMTGVGLIIVLACSQSSAGTQELPEAGGIVDFQKDVRPILSDTCYKCHGPDEQERQGGLRLDTREGAIDSGAVVEKDPDASELYQRVISDDPDTIMPPPDSGRELTEQQKQILKRWIEQGAVWQNHWSLVPPTKSPLPTVKNTTWSQGFIDRFILAELESRGWKPAVEADRRTLIRRVSLDLIGLPPEPELLHRFAASETPNWYEQLVDELLASPAYGEHMARYWLDAARYGDTHGLHLDNYREMWPYRDWVITAFNRNLSYRDFTVEQLAGDMLPDATMDQRIASGFNRAHVTTNEGGSITEEVYVRNVVDRVATTGTVFMGLTVGCAQCHDHKFDPISQKEFYQLFAFFNNMTDPPMDRNIKNPAPVISVLSDDLKQQQDQLQAELNQAIAALDDAVDKLEYQDPAAPEDVESSQVNEQGPFEFNWVQGNRFPQEAQVSGSFEVVAKGDADQARSARQQVGNGTIQHFFTGASIPLMAQKGDTLFADVYLDPDNPPEEVMLQFNDGSWEHRAYWGANKVAFGADNTPGKFHAGPLPETGKWVRLEISAEKVGFTKSRPINGMAFTQYGGKAFWDIGGIVSQKKQTASFVSLTRWLDYLTENKAAIPTSEKAVLDIEASKRTAEQQARIRRYFLLKVNADSAGRFKDQITARDAAQAKLDAFQKQIPTTLVSQESQTIKDAFMLNRGEYDQPGEKVARATPAALPAFDSSLPVDRLGFAKWLTSGKHPLTARVAVNRFWQQIFGTGIVKTSEDFGSQGDLPTHPELLDYLAVDFVEHGWDVKRLMKQLVMSSSYRQSSAVTPELAKADPENRYLARGPRFRLDAEVLRDQALAISRLLNRKMGGPSVKPPQPDGLWFAVGYSGSNTVRFKGDSGSDKIFRRSVYTFWKRTAPPPQMNTFDAPSREECRVRRERTNTPLQALLLMNEPQYLESARNLAQWNLDQQTEDDQQLLAGLFSGALGRQPSAAELDVLTSSLRDHRQEFAANPKQAKALLALGSQPADLNVYDPIELASLTMVANLVMNSDEFVCKN